MSSSCLRIIALLAVASAAYGAGDVFDQMDNFWHTVDEQFDKLGAKLDATFKADEFNWEQPRSHVVEDGNTYKIIIEMKDVTESEIRVQTFKNIVVVNAVHEEPGNEKQYQHTQVIPPGHSKFGKWRFEKGILTLIFEKLGSNGDGLSGQHNTVYAGSGRKPLPSNDYHHTTGYTYNGQSQENSQLPQTHQIRRPQLPPYGSTVPDQGSSNNGYRPVLSMVPQNRVPISPATIVDTSTVTEQRGNTGAYGRRKPTEQATSQIGQIGNTPSGAIHRTGQRVANGAYGESDHASSVPEQTGQPTDHTVQVGVSGQGRGPSSFGAGGAQTNNIGQPGYREATETSDLLGGSAHVGQSSSSGYPNIQPIGQAARAGVNGQGRGPSYGGRGTPTNNFGQSGYRGASQSSDSRDGSVNVGQSSTGGYPNIQPIGQAAPAGENGQGRGPIYGGRGAPTNNFGQSGYRGASENSDSRGGSVHVGQSSTGGYPNIQPIGQAAPAGVNGQGRGPSSGGRGAPINNFGQSGYRGASENSDSRGGSVLVGQSSTGGYPNIQPIEQTASAGVSGQGRGPNYAGGRAPESDNRGASESSDSRGGSVDVGQSNTGNHDNSQSIGHSGDVQPGRIPEGSSGSTNQFHPNGGQGISSSNYAGSRTQATNSERAGSGGTGEQSGGYNDPNAFRTSVHRQKSGRGFVNGDPNTYRQWMSSQSSSRAQYGVDNEGRVIPMAGQDVSLPDGINVHESRQQFHTVSETRTVHESPDGTTGDGDKRNGGVRPNNERPEGDTAPQSSANANRPGGRSRAHITSQSADTKPRQPTKA